MEKVLEYTLREEDLAITAGGLVNLILKNCVRVTGHEISAAKFTRDGITCGGRTVHVSERILPGQTLRVVLPEDERRAGKILPVEPPEDLDILYEDEDLVIVNKPAGTAVHPSPGHYAGTMANYLAYHLQQQGQGSVCRIIGRLDKDSEGMLVFTNDGEFANKVMHPRNSVYKFYRVTVRPGITEEQLVKLETGVEIDGKKTAPAIVHVLVQDKEANRVVLEMILHEGKNREIRKMCAAVGLEVARLRRTQIGGVKMGMLKQGDWRDLTEKEVKNLLANPIVNGRVI